MHENVTALKSGQYKELGTKFTKCLSLFCRPSRWCWR